ncbi:sensor histidine kinase [Catellatospora tritici]|uniref:sensor histidine kinase n=1 Tax=Catellatospora tritici TaxID=2851566 RepID=UPI001C2DE9AB|nr:sensor histidine kinase [Catellatospora tritici]MBV1854488.1 sensor histidine kinase [Catellatospora tritici]
MTWDSPEFRDLRARRGRALPIVVGLIQVFAVFAITHTTFSSMSTGGAYDLPLLGYGLLFASAASLYLIRRSPVVALAATAACTAAYVVLQYPPIGPFFLALVIALASAVVLGHRTAAWITAALAYAAWWQYNLPVAEFIHNLPVAEWRHQERLIAGAFVLAAPLLFGQLIRSNRDRVIEIRRRRVGDERLRIAREVHDVVAHHISLINVQAGVALHLMDADPEQARTALTAIKTASRDTLRELRTTLGVLRGVDEDAPRTPAPSLTRLDELVERFAAAGLRVDLRVTGTPRALTAAVDLAAYRIVQESLTNVHRHAGVDNAQVTIGYGADELLLDITDRGRGGVPGDGNGLAGIRERVASLGGTVAVGPRAEGGFTVCAALPTGAA